MKIEIIVILEIYKKYIYVKLFLEKRVLNFFIIKDSG